VADRFTSGIPDCWYSAHYDLWVEYKYYPNEKTIPKVVDLTNLKAKVGLSALQQNWLEARHAEGRPVAVVCGSYAGAVVFPGLSWKETTLTREKFLAIASNLPKPRDVASLLTTLLTDYGSAKHEYPSDHYGGSQRAA
jgi:hypothetical protein